MRHQQRVVQGRRNGQRRQRPHQLIPPLPRFEQPGLQRQLGQLFDKQWHSIGGGYQMVEYLCGQVDRDQVCPGDGIRKTSRAGAIRGNTPAARADGR